MSSRNTSNVGSSGLLSQIDKKIKNLVTTKKEIENREKDAAKISPLTAQDLAGLDITEDLAKLKEIQRERLLEDMSLILNDKIQELEQKKNPITKKNLF